MSVLTAPSGARSLFYKILDDTIALEVAGSDDNPVWIDWFQANEYAGGTPNLTLALYDGVSVSYNIGIGGFTWITKAVTAKQSLLFSEGFMIPKAWRLRATCSVANNVMLIGTQAIVKT